MHRLLIVLFFVLVVFIFISFSTALADTTLHAAMLGDYGRLVPQWPYPATGLKLVANMIKRWASDLAMLPSNKIDTTTNPYGFHIFTMGDNNYPEGGAATIDDNIGSQFSDWIYKYKGKYPSNNVNNMSFFHPCLGNHDGYCCASTGGVRAGPYMDYFSQNIPLTSSGNRRYYDMVIGPVHFIIVNSNQWEPDGITVTSKQALWVQQVLAGSTAPHRIVVHHHVEYADNDVDRASPALRWPYRAWGASVVVAGHEHIYSVIRMPHDGTLLIANGLGGTVPIYAANRTHPPGRLVFFNGTWGAQKLTATRQKLTLDFHAVDGSYFDSRSFDAVYPPKAAATTTTAAPAPSPGAGRKSKNKIGLGIVIGIAVAVFACGVVYGLVVWFKPPPAAGGAAQQVRGGGGRINHHDAADMDMPLREAEHTPEERLNEM